MMSAPSQPLVTQKVRYYMPEAGEVFLVWGIDGWNVVPEEVRPTGTAVENGVMHTPMADEGGIFVAKIQVPSGTALDYGFQIRKTRSGMAISWVWDGDYHATPSQDSVIGVTSNFKLMVTQEIRYCIPDAGEVFLVWGVNNWTAVPETMRPAGTTVRDGLMCTPMARVEDSFVAQLQVPFGTVIDYLFYITKTRHGAAVEVWDNNGDPGRNYHTVAAEDGVVEVQAPPSVQDSVSTSTLGAGLRWRERLTMLLTRIGVVAGSMTAPYFRRFRSAFRPSHRLVTLPIAIILVAAAVLRFNHITQPFTDAFSWRQVSVAMMAENYYRTNWNIFYPEVNWSGPGPSYQGREFQTVSYMAALLYRLIGQQDWVGRSIAVLFGLWGIFALYQLVRRVWDEEHAIASAAVMAVLPGSIFIDRSFLPDPATVALVVTSFWMLIVYLQTEQLRYLVLASMIGVWGFSTKIPGLIVGLPMAYAMLAVLGPRRIFRPKKLVALGIFAIATLAPVAAYYLWARHLALSYPPYHFAGDGNWLWNDGLQQWLSQRYFLPRLAQRLIDWMWTAPPIVLAGLSLLLPPPVRKDPSAAVSDQQPIKRLGGAPWLFHWWLLAGGVYYLVGAKELVENPWNLHILNPAVAALTGHAIIAIASFMTRITRTPVSLVTAVVLLFTIGVSGHQGLQLMYYPYARDGYELGLALREVTQSSDLVVTIGPNFGDPVPIYYSQRRGWGFPPPSLDYAWNQLPEDDNTAIQLFEGLRRSEAGWLGIVKDHYEEIWRDHPLLAEHIERTCEFRRSGTGGVIYRILSPEEVANLTLPRDPMPESVASAPLVTKEIRYQMPEAGKVFLVWGGNGWQAVAEGLRPAGTVMENGVMHTPMVHAGDTFVAKVQVPAGTILDYGFQIRKPQQGSVISRVWDGDYRMIPSEDGIVEVASNVKLEVTQAIRYRMPEAGKVYLVWGVNGWAALPEELHPAGTEMRDGLMHTPMAREGDVFLVKVPVPYGATMDYGFLITENRSGGAIEAVFDGGQGHHLVATQDGLVEVRAALTLEGGQAPSGVREVELPVLVSLGIVFGMGAVLISRGDPIPIAFKALHNGRQLTYLRDLLRELVVRDMKLRYKRSILGVAWSLLNPLFQILVFVFLSRRVLSLDIPNYPSFVFAGVLAWNWFHAAVLTTTSAITSGRELVGRPGFPTAILPVVTVTTNLIHFLLALPVLLLFLVLGGGRLAGAILALPLVILLQFLLVLGLGYLVATVNVTFRDTQHLLDVVFRLLFFLTPVFYDASSVPARYQNLYRLNPMFHLIAAYRAVFIQGAPPDYRALLAIAAFSGGLLWLGHTIFARASTRFVEEL